MKVDRDYLLFQYPTDESIIDKFISTYENDEFSDFLHMLRTYEDFFDNLNLTYIEDAT